MLGIDTNDWMCFIDGDAIHTTTWFGKRIEEVIKYNTEFDIFTCYTNRSICPNQVGPGSNWIDNDMLKHRELGESLWNLNKTKVIEPKPPRYWRERIEFLLIIVGLAFWIQYWSQISLK